MRLIDRMLYWILSVFILVLTSAGILITTNIFGLGDIVVEAIAKLPTFFESAPRTRLIVLGIEFLVLIFSIKGIFFQSKTREVDNQGVLLENNNGKLAISRETLENLVRDLAVDIPGTDNTTAKIYLDKNNNLIITVDVVINRNGNIKEISKELQEMIKTELKKITDLDVAEVNLNIRNISNRKANPRKYKQSKVTRNTIVDEENPLSKKAEEKLENKVEIETEKIEVKEDIKTDNLEVEEYEEL